MKQERISWFHNMKIWASKIDQNKEHQIFGLEKHSYRR